MAELAPTVLGRLRSTLPEHADPVRAAAMSAYMRDKFAFLGIPSTPLTALTRQALAGLPRPTSADAAGIALGCWAMNEREYQYVACAYLRRHVRVLDAGFMATLRELVVTKSWWDTVDALAAHVAGPLREAYPEVVVILDEWAAGEELWPARTAILHQLRYRARTDAERLFRYCAMRADHPDFFMRKAIGWALREYAKTDPAAVVRFVESHELSGLSRREALKNLPR
ncbi:DNA alkylation repair protein [Hamadaea tsunoensis]|uniref:DNA alkylation repair protein n=1 Tax=Hamadaea tsunoensis TaxID=53368 RepID=UPI000401229B|nr:DNA alkylation repair protein [Hamadaea tsunoensis]